MINQPHLLDRKLASSQVQSHDRAPKPDHYGFEALGCTHELRFPVVKLLDYGNRIESLEADPNPFALVTAAHLRTRQTKNDPQARHQAEGNAAKTRQYSRLAMDWGCSKKLVSQLWISGVHNTLAGFALPCMQTLDVS